MNIPRINVDGSARVLELLRDILPSKDIGSLVAGRSFPGVENPSSWWILQPARCP